MRYNIGMESGLGGAICMIDKEMAVELIFDIPTIYRTKNGRKRTCYDIPQLTKRLNELPVEDVVVMIEETYPRSVVLKGTPTTNYNLGYNYGIFIGYFVARGIRYETVMPKTWQKEFFAGPASDTKVRSYECASRLFPNTEVKTERGRLLDGRCDCLLIAEYGRRRLVSNGIIEEEEVTVPRGADDEVIE